MAKNSKTSKTTGKQSKSNKNVNESKPEQKNPLKITARIDKIIDKSDGNLKAIASINIGDKFAVHGFRILESQNGLFVSMPNSSYKDGEGKTQYNDTFHPITKESREVLIREIKKAYEQALENKQDAKQEEEEAESEAENEIPFEGPVL